MITREDNKCSESLLIGTTGCASRLNDQESCKHATSEPEALFKCRLNAQLIGITAKKVLNKRSPRSVRGQFKVCLPKKPLDETRQFCINNGCTSSSCNLARPLLCHAIGGSQRCGGTRWLHQLRRGLKEGKVRKLACSRSHGCVARAGSSCRENCFGGSRGGKGDGFVHPLFCCAMLFLRAVTHDEVAVPDELSHSMSGFDESISAMITSV